VFVINIGSDAMMRCGATLIPGMNFITGSVSRRGGLRHPGWGTFVSESLTDYDDWFFAWPSSD